MNDSDIITETFTKLAPRYEESMDRELGEIWGISYEEFIGRLAEVVSIENGDVVLDVATGTARIPLKTASEAGAGSVIVGLDITPAMLKYGLANIEARGLSRRIRLVCASAMDMPFGEGVFDAAICGLGMHHMDVPRVLSEVRRVLKEGGQLVIASVGALPSWRVPWRDALMRMCAFLYFALTHGSARGRAEAAALSNVYTADEWRGMLSDLGFTKIEVTAEFAGCRFFYPDALIMRASK